MLGSQSSRKKTVPEVEKHCAVLPYTPEVWLGIDKEGMNSNMYICIYVIYNIIRKGDISVRKYNVPES